LVLAAVVLLAASSGVAQIPPRDIKLLSQTSHGFAAEGRSEAPAVNLNGLLNAYSSDAADLVSPPFQNPRNQVYARDIEVVVSELVSVAPDGKAGNLASQDSGFPPGISSEGRFVAFSSRASNLVPDDTNGVEDIFVYDRNLDATELISRGTDGPSNGGSSFPKISADGRYVVFQSSASNLVADDTNGVSDIFVFDRTDQVMTLVTISPNNTPANGLSITPNISGDGRVVAFASRATNLVAEVTTGTFEQIYVSNWQDHAITLASINDAGKAGNAISFLPALSADGGQIAFKSEAFNLVPNDTNGVPDVFVRDRTNETTQRVSVDDFGNQSNGLSGGPGISGDGRFVAFPSFASNLVPEDSNGLSDVYVYDRDPPDRDQGRIAIVTLGFDGQPANNGVSDFPVTVSGDGRWIGFASSASNLVAVDLNNDLDAFIGCNPFDEFDCAPPTPTPTPTNTPGMEFCIGDCDGDGMVSVADLVRMVNIALNLQALCPDGGPGCLAGDGNCDCEITVDEIVRAVQNSLRGCVDFGSCTIGEHIEMCCEGPIGTPTATASATITPTPPTPAATPSETPTQSENTMCVGDCEGIGQVSVADLVRMVNIALGLQSLCPDGNAGCLAGDADCDCDITVDEVILAVNNALRGCMNFDTCSPAEHEALCCATP
jgi:Tol biopolymer transport system component